MIESQFNLDVKPLSVPMSESELTCIRSVLDIWMTRLGTREDWALDTIQKLLDEVRYWRGKAS